MFSQANDAWCDCMNSYYRSFPSGFLFGCKGREGECLRTVHRGWLGAAPPQWRQCWICPWILNHVHGETSYFHLNNKFLTFSSLLLLFFFLANVYFVYSSPASIACEAQTNCGSSLLSLPRGFAARSRVLARLASLAQIGELASRLFFYLGDRKPKLWLGLPQATQ